MQATLSPVVQSVVETTPKACDATAMVFVAPVTGLYSVHTPGDCMRVGKQIEALLAINGSVEYEHVTVRNSPWSVYVIVALLKVATTLCHLDINWT